ncbi:MAG: hypothetical protein AABY88_07870 [Pseudomonadota bacterium]
MTNIQEAMIHALSDLRERLMQGADPDAAITEIADYYDIKPDTLRIRADLLLQDSSMIKFPDEESRRLHLRHTKIKAAKDAAISAQIDGGEKGALYAIKQSLGQEFSDEEKEQICIDFLIDEVRKYKQKPPK